MVVRYGFSRSGDLVADARVLFTVTNPGEIAEFQEQLAFERNQYGEMCGCYGILRIEWYKEEQLLASTSLMHGRNLRWEHFEGDARLTDKSAKWLVRWFGIHGLPEQTASDPPLPK